MNDFTKGETITITVRVAAWAREGSNWVGTTARVAHVDSDYIILKSDHDGRPFALLFPGGVPYDINKFLGDA